VLWVRGTRDSTAPTHACGFQGLLGDHSLEARDSWSLGIRHELSSREAQPPPTAETSQLRRAKEGNNTSVIRRKLKQEFLFQ